MNNTLQDEQYLAQLEKRQKKSIQAQLDAKKQEALNSINQQQAQAKPLYQQQRQQANTQSQLQSKNFAEYLANRGSVSSGASNQGQISINNALMNNIGGINQNENTFNQDLANQRIQANNTYQTDLASNNANIESDYLQNLLNLRQQERARQDQLKAQQQQNSIAWYNAQTSRMNATQPTTQSYKDTVLKYQPGVIASAVPSGNKMVYTLATGDTLTLDKGVNPFTGTINKDAYIKDEDANKQVLSVFGNGYQPNNVGGSMLKSSGAKVGQVLGNIKGSAGQDLSNQNLWADESGKLWYWDGALNKYQPANG